MATEGKLSRTSLPLIFLIYLVMFSVRKLVAGKGSFMRIIEAISKAIRGISRVLFIVSCAILFGLLGVVFYNVILRYIFNAPTAWAEEISAAIMLVVIGMLPTAWIFVNRQHIKFDLVSKSLSSRKQKIVEIIVGVAGLVFSGLLVWEGGMATHMVFVKHMRMPSLLGTPLWIPYLIVVIGIGMFGLHCLVRIVENMSYLIKKR